MLIHPYHTLLHCSALVERKYELSNQQKDYLEELEMNIIAFAQQNEIVVDENFTDLLLVSTFLESS